MPKIHICIWSNDKAIEMAEFYQSVFKGTKIGKPSYWGSKNKKKKQAFTEAMWKMVKLDAKKLKDAFDRA